MFKVGDKVRVTRDVYPWANRNDTVTITEVYTDAPYPYRASPNGGSPYGSLYEAHELEAIAPEPDLQAEIEALTEKYARLIEQKDAALTIAAFIFGQYHQLHMAKGTNESTMKALTNLGLERMMLDAIEAG